MFLLTLTSIKTQCTCFVFYQTGFLVKRLFLLAYLRVVLQQPDNSSDEIPYLNLLGAFTSSLLVTAPPCSSGWSDLCFRGQNNQRFSSRISSTRVYKKSRPCTSALLLQHTPLLAVFVFSPRAVRIRFMDLKST